MTEKELSAVIDHLPFFIAHPDQTDIVLILVLVLLILIVLGFGVLYFTIQAWPDRLAAGASKTQLQIVGILGLISLFTLNNAFWVAALLIAAIRVPDFMTPFREIAKALTTRSVASVAPVGETEEEIDDRGDGSPDPLEATREESANRPGTEA